MIFEQPFLTTFMTTFSLILTLCFYFLSVFFFGIQLSLSVTLISAPQPKFLCIFWLFIKLSDEVVLHQTR